MSPRSSQESTTHPSTTHDNPDAAVPVLEILKAIEEAVTLLGRQIDEMHTRLEG